MVTGQLWLAINSDLKDVRLLASAAYQVSLEADLDVQAAEAVRLCIAEAANNAVEHAYGNQSGRQVELTVSILPHLLRFDLIDHGEAMPMGLLDGPSRMVNFDPSDTQSLPTGGMGLFIIRSTMNRVEYYSEGNVNHFVMEKRRVAEEEGRG